MTDGPATAASRATVSLPRSDQRGQGRDWTTLGLVLCSFLLGLGALGGGSHHDETTYLNIGLEMEGAGAWLTPLCGGEPCWHKPPLLYWGERLAYGVFGRTLFAGRLPVALCGVALALLVGALAGRMFDRRAVAFAALATASTFGLVKFGRVAMMDVPLALACTWAAYGLWCAHAERAPKQLLHLGAAAGLSTLLKGPVSLVILALFAVPFLGLHARWAFRSAWLWLSAALAAALALPWFVASYLLHGEAFVRFFFLRENLGKFERAWSLEIPGKLVVSLWVFLLPWAFLWLGAVLRSRGQAPERDEAPQRTLLWSWLAAVFLVFSVPTIAFPHYVVPALPACVLMASSLGTGPTWSVRATAWLFGLLGALLALAGAGAVRLGLSWPAVGVAFVCSGLLGLAARRFVSSREQGAALVCGAMALFLGVVLPLAAGYPRDLDARVGERPLVTFQVSLNEMVGVGHGAARGVESMDEAYAAAETEGAVMVAPAGAVAGLGAAGEGASTGSGAPDSSSQWRAVARWHRWRSPLYVGELLRGLAQGDRGLVQEEMVALERRRGTP